MLARLTLTPILAVGLLGFVRAALRPDLPTDVRLAALACALAVLATLPLLWHATRTPTDMGD